MPGRAPDHETDAGGDPRVLAAKATLRREVWAAMKAAKAARFPGADGRIPNFVGAELAADHLRECAEWQGAVTLKSNPDSPQLPVRQRALQDGKTLYMAVPRLASDKPFLALDPAVLTVPPRQAASIGGAAKYGRPVQVTDMKPVDLVITGCVAVSADGARLGKGGGYSDLEYALAAAAGLIGPATLVATTVHDQQVLDDGRIPQAGHDFRLDLIVTPTRVIHCPRPRGRHRHPGIRWEELTDEKIAAIPLLGRLRRSTSASHQRQPGGQP
jgi:5-formyltetrahydrofolate cyclo-ligase